VKNTMILRLPKKPGNLLTIIATTNLLNKGFAPWSWYKNCRRIAINSLYDNEIKGQRDILRHTDDLPLHTAHMG
jgi:hypothetical protein